MNLPVSPTFGRKKKKVENDLLILKTLKTFHQPFKQRGHAPCCSLDGPHNEQEFMVGEVQTPGIFGKLHPALDVLAHILDDADLGLHSFPDGGWSENRQGASVFRSGKGPVRGVRGSSEK